MPAMRHLHSENMELFLQGRVWGACWRRKGLLQFPPSIRLSLESSVLAGEFWVTHSMKGVDPDGNRPIYSCSSLLFAASPLSVATGLLVNVKEDVQELAATNGLELKS